MILEDGDMGNARVKAELIVACLVDTHDVGDVDIGHERHSLGVVRGFDDHVVDAEPLDGAAGAVHGAGGWDLTSQ
jgi:hypothetical protein